MNTTDKKKKRITSWIIAHQNASMMIVFSIIAVIALIPPGGGGSGGGNGSGSSDENGNGGSGNGDSLSYQKEHVNVNYYENGDTSSAAYYNAEGKRTKYIEKYANGVTSSIWQREYTGDRQIDENTNFFENGKTSAVTRKINDKLDGEQLLFHENGSLKLKRSYTMGKETDTAYFYDKNGGLEKKEAQKQ